MKVKHNQTIEVIGIVATALAIIIGAVVALNWWIILQIDGAASAALAGAFLMFEGYTLILILFNVFGLTSELIRAQIERFRFRDNVEENREVAQTAILAAKADKERAAAEFNQVRTMQTQMKQLAAENRRLQQVELEPEMFFSDNGHTVIEEVVDNG